MMIFSFLLYIMGKYCDSTGRLEVLNATYNCHMSGHQKPFADGRCWYMVIALLPH